METISVIYGQNILDLALQNYGKAESFIDLAIANNISLSEVFYDKQLLQVDKQANQITAYFDRIEKIINTGSEETAQSSQPFSRAFSSGFGNGFS